MASIHKDIPIEAPAHEVWDAVRDFGALHTRLVPGFVLDTKLDGDVRIVSFANGTSAREQLIDSDDERRRLGNGRGAEHCQSAARTTLDDRLEARTSPDPALSERRRRYQP